MRTGRFAMQLPSGSLVVAAGRRHRAAQGSSAIKIPFESYTLPNGLTVILSVDRTTPTVAVNVWYHVGSKNEVAGAHRLRAPLRARDVHRLGPRAVRPARQADRRRRRLQQRHDLQRSHELLRDGAVELPRVGAVARSRSHGLSARHARSRQAQRAARHRQERAAPERRQPALRPRRSRFSPSDLSGVASVLVGRHRQHGGPVGRVGRGRQELLPALLRAEQRVSGDRRRLRSGAGEGVGREVLRRHPARQADHAADGRAGDAGRGDAGSSTRTACRCRGSTCSGRPSARRATIASRWTCSGPSCPARARRGSPRRSSTTSRRRPRSRPARARTRTSAIS